MKICDHVTEKCFEPKDAWKKPCPCAIAHEPRPECKGTRCERFAEFVDGKAQNPTWTKHVEI